MPAWGPQPHQIGTLAIGQTGGAGRQLVAQLQAGITSWTVPKTSKYTFYVYGAGGSAAGGSFSRITKSLSVGTVLNCDMSPGYFYTGSSSISPFLDTTLSGGGINIVAGMSGRPATGGDFNEVGTGSSSGGDGTVFGPRNVCLTVVQNGLLGYIGRHPGGPSPTANNWSVAGGGEIRIVDETP